MAQWLVCLVQALTKGRRKFNTPTVKSLYITGTRMDKPLDGTVLIGEDFDRLYLYNSCRFITSLLIHYDF